jgi:hypothetical protein
MVDLVLHLWLKFQRNIKQRISSFVSVVGVYVGLPTELSILNSFIKQSMQCDLHTKTILLGALSAETIIYLRRDRCLAIFGSLKIDVEQVLIDPLRFLILICISDLTLFTYCRKSI